MRIFEAVKVLLQRDEGLIVYEHWMYFSFHLWAFRKYNLISPGRAAIDQIFRVINEQSQPTFDENFNLISFFNWTGGGGSLSPSVNNLGNGEPKAYTGLVGTHHRPSDDESIFRKRLAIWARCKNDIDPTTSLPYSC